MTSDSWFATREHRPGVWLVAAPPHVNSFLVAGAERAILVDTGPGIGDIRGAVAGLTDLDLAVVNTHYHWDHSGGNSRFDDIAIHELGAEKLRRGPDMAKLEPYAAYTRRMLDRFGEFRATDEAFFGFLSEETTPGPLPDDFDFATWRIPATIPTRLLKDGDRIDLGGRALQVLHTPGHTPDSICLFDEENGLLFGGDTYNTGPIYAHLPDRTSTRSHARRRGSQSSRTAWRSSTSRTSVGTSRSAPSSARSRQGSPRSSRVRLHSSRAPTVREVAHASRDSPGSACWCGASPVARRGRAARTPRARPPSR